MNEFIIDKRGENSNSKEIFDDTDCVIHDLNTKKFSIFETLPELHDVVKLNKKDAKKSVDVNDSYIITNYSKNENNKFYPSSTKTLLANSSLKPGLEKEYSVPIITKKIFKLRRKELREKTKGANWFNIPATEVTDDIKADLKVLKMRSVLDRSHFYKKNNIKSISKYFQVGKVVESSADFYGGRIVKSQRKKTIVDELLADAECKRYQKKKYKEIMDVNRKRRGRNSNKKNKT